MDRTWILLRTIASLQKYRPPLALAFVDTEETFDSVETFFLRSSTKEWTCLTRAHKPSDTQDTRRPLSFSNFPSLIFLIGVDSTGRHQGAEAVYCSAALDNEVADWGEWGEKGIGVVERFLSNFRPADDIERFSNSTVEAYPILLSQMKQGKGQGINRKTTRLMKKNGCCEGEGIQRGGSKITGALSYA